MTRRRDPSARPFPKGPALLTLGVLLASGLGAAGLAEHALGDLVPNSGNRMVDQTMDTLREDLDRLRKEPQVPANYFFSSAGRDLRIGGFGSWRALAGTQKFASPGPTSTDWQENQLHPEVGSWGFSLGNEPSGRYRAGVYDAYYVSPLIDLRSLTFTTGQAPVQRVEPVGGATATVPPLSIGIKTNVVQINVTGLVTLRFDHKFQLGQSNDGARVEVFTLVHEPRPGAPTAPDAILLPSPVVRDDGPALTPEAQNYRPTKAFGTSNNAAFTGRQSEWAPVEFNLTSFIGQAVYVAFHVRVNIPGFLAPSYFDDPRGERFPAPRADFYGWKIDAVQVEGVSHLTNLRVPSLSTPTFRDAINGPLQVPTGSGPLRGDHAHFEAIIENRGAVTEEDVPVTFAIDRLLPNGTTAPHSCPSIDPEGDPGVVVLPRLRPGDNAVAAIDCEPFLEEETQYHFTAHVESASGREDGDPGDNDLRDELEARTVARFTTLQPLRVHPPIGETDQVRSLVFEARNDGNDDFLIAMGLEGPPSMQVGPPGNAPRTALVPVGSTVKGEWELLLPLPGEFQVRFLVQNALDGSTLLNVPFQVTSDLSPGTLFFDDYTKGVPAGQIIGPAEWTHLPLWPPPPPHPDWDETYWDLAVNEPEKGVPPGDELSVLWGRRRDPGSLASTREFSRLEVRIVHYLDTRRIGDNQEASGIRGEEVVFRIGFVPQEFAGPYLGRAPPFFGDLSPGGVVESMFGLKDFAGPDQPLHRYMVQPGLVLLQSIHPTRIERDRERFYRLQWVDETYEVRPEDFRPGLASIPESLLGAYRLGIAAMIPRGLSSHNPFIPLSAECRSPAPAVLGGTPEQNLINGVAAIDQCPVWWVDQVVVTAYPTNPAESPVTYLQTTGDPADARLESTEIQRLVAGGSPTFGLEVGYWSSESYSYEHYLGTRLFDPGAPMGILPLRLTVLETQRTPGRCTLKVRDNVDPQAPVESAQDPENLEESEDIAHGCVIWERTKGLPLVPHTNTWQLTQKISTGGLSVWWLGDPSTFGSESLQRVYASEPQVNALITPTISIPSGLQDPKLLFEHKYRFHRNLRSDGSEFGRVTDYGAVYVQSMRLDESGKPVPDSPLFQLVMRPPPPSNLPYEESAFTKDCTFVEKCNDMRETAAESVAISLGPDLRFLDYWSVNQSSARFFAHGGFFNPVGFKGDRLDVLAYQLGARSMREGGLLRLAFVHGGYGATGIDYSSVPDDGWAIGPVLITGDTRLGRNLHLDSVGIETKYDRANGLGPSTAAEIVVRMRNLGLFTIRGVDVAIEFEKDPVGSSTVEEQKRTLDDVLLKTDESAEVRIPVILPEAEGQYTISVRVAPRGADDDDPLDNCGSVDPGAPLGRLECIPGTPLNRVRTHRDASLLDPAGQPLARIVPLQGRVDNPSENVFFPRSVLATLRNTGNVPIGGGLSLVRLGQSVARIETGPSGETQLGTPKRMEWRLLDVLEAGDEVRLNAANFQLVSMTPPGQAEFLINFDRPGRYLIRFEALVPQDQVGANDRVDLLAEAWEVFYSNNFESFGAAEERLGLVSGDFVTDGAHKEAWAITDRQGFRTPTSPGERSYWFGDPVTETYPSGADATLTLPALDLTSASQAFFNFRSKYDLERGYDGGRVEASTDGGATWFPLRPKPIPGALPNGYPGHIVSSNPLNPGHDPLIPVDAFTGTSTGVVEGSDWVPFELDLSEAVPEFRRPLVVESFEQKGFPLESDRIVDQPRNRTNGAWTLTEGECSTFRCWYAENAGYGGPIPLSDHPQFWWSGNGIDGSTVLILMLAHPSVNVKAYGAGKQLELTWWQWTVDPGAPGLCVTFETEPLVSQCFSPTTTLLREVRGEWRRYSHLFTLPERDRTVFRFVYTPGAAVFQRGLAIAGATLTRFDALPGGGRVNVEDRLIPMHEGEGIWKFGTGAPSGLLKDGIGPPLWSPRANTTATAAGPILFAIGGIDPFGLVPGSVLYEVGVGTRDVSALPTPPGARQGATAVNVGGTIYVLGGATATGHTTQIVKSFTQDYSTEANKNLHNLPKAKANLTAVTDGAVAYLIGGDTASGLSGEILTWNPGVNSPTNPFTNMTVSPPLPPRSHTSAVLQGKFVYIFGGRTASGLSDAIHRFDTTNSQLTVLPARLPTPRAETSAVSDGTNAYVFGGLTPAGPTAEVLRFDPVTEQLTNLGPVLPTPRAGTSAAIANGLVYVFGGYRPQGLLADVLRFNPADTSLQVETRSCLEGCLSLGWRITSILNPGPTGWRITDTRPNHDDIVEPVWVFRDSVPSGTDFRLPLLANERLVTPMIDLSRVVGSASLGYWHRGVLPAGTNRIVEIQVQDRLASPPRWGLWTPLATESASLTLPDWTKVGPVDLSASVGQRIRLGFRIQTTANQLLNADTGWSLDGIQLQGETMVAGPLLIRFHAGTDAGIGDGGWGIDNMEIVGRRYSREVGNLAVVLDNPGSTREVEPGTRITFAGTLRNLSPRTWIGKGVLGEVLVGTAFVPMEADPPSPLGKPGLVGPVLLLTPGSKDIAGNPLDRSRFSLSFDLPAAAGMVTVRIRAVDASTLIPVRDENLGDHAALVRVELKSQNRDPQLVDARLAPADPDPSTPVALTFKLRNSATVDVDVQLTPRIRPLATGSPVSLDSRTLRVGPQSFSPEQSWTWTPEAAGTYAVEIQKQTTYLRPTGPEPASPKIDFVWYAFVGQRLVFASEDFDTVTEVADDGPDPVTDAWVRAVGPGTCSTGVNPATLWTPTDEFAYRPSESLRSGVSQEEFLLKGSHYPSNLDDELRQPLLDLSPLVDVGRSDQPGSLTVPSVFLNFWHRSFTEPNRDGLKVQARLLEENAFNPQRWDVTPAGCTGSALLGGLLDDWRLASLALPTVIIQQQKPIQFLYRFVSDATNELQGVYLDAMTVSAYNAQVETGSDQFALQDNADKVFHVRVTNLAPVRDTFDLRLDSDSTTLGSDVATVELEPTVLTLAPGEAQAVTVRVHTALSRNLAPTGALNLGILATSRGDPNRVALGQIGFTQFAPRNWPDLVVEFRLAGEPEAREGESFTFLAQVSNFGLAPSPATDYEVYACPASLSIDACRQDPKSHRLEAGELPSILPFEQTRSEQLSRILFTVTWRPKMGTSGEYQLVLLADPKQAVVDYDRTNNQAVQLVSLQKLALPDLRIDTFELMDDQGHIVTGVFEGQVVRIRAVVRNAGDEAAPNVRISIVNQFELKKIDLLSLAPGEATEVRANWVATAGTAILKVQTTTTRPELNLENNVVAKKLVVKRRDIALTGDLTGLQGLPGDAWTVPLTLTNTGESSAEVRLRVLPPSGFRADVSPEEAVVDVLDRLPVTVHVAAAEAPPGAYLLQVEATIEGAADNPIVVTVPIELGGRASPRSAPVVVTTARGQAESVSLPLVNSGSESAAFTPRVHAPAGWRVVPRTPIIELAPGASEDVTFDVTIPPNFAPGEYVVRVEFDGPQAPKPSELRIAVPPHPELVVETLRDVEGPGHREVLVRVRSVGNAEATPDLLLTLDDGSVRVRIDPPLRPLRPGESSLHTIILVAPGGLATPSLDGITVARQTLGAAATRVSIPPASVDLSLGELRVLPGLLVRPGQVLVVETRVRNEGGVVLPPVPVALYANGRLADYASVEVPPGKSELVRFRLAAATEPMVLLAAVDPFDALPESNRENNAALASIQVESGGVAKASVPGFSVVLLWVAALWVAGRRRSG